MADKGDGCVSRESMNQLTAYNRAGKPGADPGLDPRAALDILDLRTREQMQSGGTELAAKTDVGPDVLHYLAQHGAAAVRVAVAANPAAAAATNRHLADDESEDVRVDLRRDG